MSLSSTAEIKDIGYFALVPYMQSYLTTKDCVIVRVHYFASFQSSCQRAEPLGSTELINIGDILQATRSSPHRVAVVLPPLEGAPFGSLRFSSRRAPIAPSGKYYFPFG
ncbi:hypothetical protein SCEN_M01740 [Saccharomyces cerevisiae]|uniref:Putative uncharacterized protein YMR031W-A n=1 Tax=Saccharomyces cerevisiae (strain ATCC 204508 / S288c) TaxID=559292 RepID=YM031_YEAST|nr:RecName: Full=Putative uncharacterized protein YMR031W-A [Saccharomyces cerevisiae S288C]pir/S69863/ hypothetical protein YMR031w-a - yeast (Saccharomyces cerevisiae) [Saccharomyces cerevisiae]AAS56727.1 YMR031W-A [Saccharomyces cerevisiae]QHB10767.1 hypothetical protein SCEN_M01740 [Saccharomyces cerevisiae]